MAKLPSPISHNINLTKNIYLVDLKNIYFSQSTINLVRSELTPTYLEKYPMKFLKINANTFILINSVGYENDWTSVDERYKSVLGNLFIPAINTVFISKSRHLVTLDNRRLFHIYTILNSLINERVDMHMGYGTKLSTFFSNNHLIDKKILIPCYINDEREVLPKELSKRYDYLKLFKIVEEKKQGDEVDEDQVEEEQVEEEEVQEEEVEEEQLVEEQPKYTQVFQEMTYGNVLIKRLIQQPQSCSDFFIGINIFPYTNEYRNYKSINTVPEPYRAIEELYYYSFDTKKDYTRISNLESSVQEINSVHAIFGRGEGTTLKKYKQFILDCLMHFRVIATFD